MASAAYTISTGPRVIYQNTNSGIGMATVGTSVDMVVADVQWTGAGTPALTYGGSSMTQSGSTATGGTQNLAQFHITAILNHGSVVSTLSGIPMLVQVRSIHNLTSNALDVTKTGGSGTPGSSGTTGASAATSANNEMAMAWPHPRSRLRPGEGRRRSPTTTTR